MVELKKISDYRSYIMGLSIILIMIFHANIPIINQNIIKQHLYIGVDIFLFLSGIGISHSLYKTNSIKQFYIKRLKKILSISLPIIIIGCLLVYMLEPTFTVNDFYFQSLFIGFIGGLGGWKFMFWYLSAILIYYLLSPLIYNFYGKSDNKLKAIIILSIIWLLLMLITLPKGVLNYLSWLTNRFGIYIIGIIFGIRIIKNEKVDLWELLFYIVLSLVGCALIYYANKFGICSSLIKILSFIPITILGCISISYSINYFNKKEKKYLFKPLKVLGEYTLSIYTMHSLLQLIIRGLLYKYKINIPIMYNIYWYELFVAMITIVFSMIWTKFINYLTNIKMTDEI